MKIPSGQAFTEAGVQGGAKMGALLSVLAAPLALIVAIVLGVSKVQLGMPIPSLLLRRAKASV